MGFLEVIRNIAIIGLKIIQSTLSVAGAIASGGVTSPLALLSLLSTTSNIVDFINDPSGNVFKTQEKALKWLGDTIKSPSATHHIVGKLNDAAGAADPLGLNIKPLGNINSSNRQVTSTIEAIGRGRGTAGLPTAYNIASLTNPAIRQLRSSANNAHDRARISTIRNSVNAEAIQAV